MLGLEASIPGGYLEFDNWSGWEAWGGTVADLAAGTAFLLAPLLLTLMLAQRRGLRSVGFGWLFVAAIFLSGAIYLLQAAAVWWPTQQVMAVVKIFAATIAWVAVVVVAARLMARGQMHGVATLDRWVGPHAEGTPRSVDAAALRQANDVLHRRQSELQDHLSIIAHDLKHPVACIAGLIQLIGLDDMPSPARRKLEVAASECQRMDQMLRQLSSLTQSGDVQIPMEPVYVDVLIADCVAQFEATLCHLDVEVVTSAPHDQVFSSRCVLMQCLNNLLDNALKYGTEPGGRIEMSAKRDDDSMAISVRDFGPGIEAAAHHRVFEPFKRLPGTSNRADGTGVGLTAVKRLIEQLGGEISLSSQPGQGATFTLHLPVGNQTDTPEIVTFAPTPALS